MKNIFAILIALTGLMTTAFSFAGSGGGKITRVYSHAGDVAIYRTQHYVSPPSCNPYGEFAISLKTYSGRAIHAQVLTAVQEDKTVAIAGTGTCTYLSRENVRYIYFNN